MSRAVLISIKPAWCSMIASGKKTVEVRKTKPNLPVPFKVYIYCTKDKHGWFDFGKKEMLDGKVIGEFICNGIKCITASNFVVKEDALRAIEGSCLTAQAVKNYAGWKNGTPLAECKDLFGWHISDLVIYDKPKPLYEFYHDCGENPKCGGCNCLYVESSENVGYYEQCCSVMEGCKPLSRPPQSWCYVEEV